VIAGKILIPNLLKYLKVKKMHVEKKRDKSRKIIDVEIGMQRYEL
jgi:hypothetical protein